jgi:hypothetical protein
MQDGDGSQQDWRDHSAIMSKVYQHCELNISASSSPDADSGFFVHRRSSTVPPQQYTYWHEQKGGLKFLSSKKVYMVTQEVFSEISLSPLAKRAWVLQERIFSPRILHFGARQILWECRRKHVDGGRRSETFPSGVPKWMETATPESLRIYDPSIIANSTIPRWRQIVEEYSARRLTRASEDKLMALQALALEHQRTHGDEYIAGLWKSNLIEQLMWHIQPEILQEKRATRAKGTTRAPTWSWASVDGPVHMGKTYNSSITVPITYVSHRIKPIDEKHPTGQISHAELTLKSHLVKAKVKKISSRSKVHTYFVQSEDGTDIDTVFLDEKDIGEVSRAQDMFGLLIFEYSKSKGTDHEVSLGGLLMRQRSSSRKLFSRIGTWACTGSYKSLLDYALAQPQVEVILV